MDIAAERDESQSLVRVAIWAGQNAHDPGLYSSTRPLFTKRLDLSRPLFGGVLYSRKYGISLSYIGERSLFDVRYLDGAVRNYMVSDNCEALYTNIEKDASIQHGGRSYRSLQYCFPLNSLLLVEFPLL